MQHESQDVDWSPASASTKASHWSGIQVDLEGGTVHWARREPLLESVSLPENKKSNFLMVSRMA